MTQSLPRKAEPAAVRTLSGPGLLVRSTTEPVSSSFCFPPLQILHCLELRPNSGKQPLATGDSGCWFTEQIVALESQNKLRGGSKVRRCLGEHGIDRVRQGAQRS